MRIQHNIAALNAYSRLGSNNSTVSKNLEKLSSGYRINRAGDDAAGLAISEKMKAQITGLGTAKKNADDGISLVQTAEGALTEVHSMLNRMTELATQSANGTYDDGVDRENLQKEVTSLKDEIDRISESTNYNGIKLLDGSLGAKGVDAGAGKAIVEGQEMVDGLADNEVKSQEAVAGEYEVKLDLDKDKSDGSTAVITGATQLDFILKDTAGNEHTLKFKFKGDADVKSKDLQSALETSSADAEFLADNEKSLKELGKIFDLSKLKFTKGDGDDDIKIEVTSKEAGTSGIGLASVTVKQRDVKDGTVGAQEDYAGNDGLSDETTATATKAPTDAYKYLEVANADVASGKKITVGDHTFEIKNADDYNVSSGNIRVVTGSTDAETKKNLVAAMKSAGIDSASLTTDGNIKIGDVNQLKTSDKAVSFNDIVDVKSESLGVKVGTQDAVNASFDFKPGNGTDGEHTLGIAYTDADGNKKSAQIKYTADGSDAKTAAASIADAINKDDKLKGLFKVSSDGSAKVTLEALGGKEGVTITAITSDDTAAFTGGTPFSGSATVSSAAASKTISLTASAIASGDTVSVGGKEYQFISASEVGDPKKLKKDATAVIIGANDDATAKNLQLAMANDGVNAGITNNVLTISDGDKPANKSGGLNIQAGDTSDSYQQVKVSVESMDTKSLDIASIDVSTQQGAKDSIDKIKAAINKVSGSRGDLGAIQNRLEHTINNLSVTEENMTAAESRVRDVDMAKEMMELTKNKILVSASQAMLAQANQIPQGVLQLLQ